MGSPDSEGLPQLIRKDLWTSPRIKVLSNMEENEKNF